MPKILVVDDDAVDRENVIRCLAPLEPLVILEAEDGDQALARIEQDRPDLVLTDLRMPRMDGLELVARVREEFATIPIVLMTSAGSEQLAVKALESGAASYVSKADLGRNLVDTVEHLLELVKARRSRLAILDTLEHRETRFELPNDPALIAPLVAFLQESLERLNFESEATRVRIGMALAEALSNAMIHGNLELDSSLRQENKEAYYQALDHRKTSEPWSRRRVRCSVVESATGVEYTIEDDGTGFDPSELPDPTAPENMSRVYGRGMLLIRTFMDRVEFNEAGNRITMTKLDSTVSS